MRFVCLWSPRWSAAGAPLAELATALLAEAPRVAVEARGVLWADVRGLPGPRVALTLLERLGPPGPEIRAGLSDVPVAAELAARSGEAPLTVVEPGRERDFLAPRDVRLLDPAPRLLSLLEGVGISTCGMLAALPRESVEVRFGADGSRLWKLARADDPRLLFGPIPWERPHASLDFVDYQVTDAARLVFTVNALLGNVCEVLRRRGERCRNMILSLALGSGSTLRRELRCARPTAEPAVWLERVRAELERLTLPDTVRGVGLEAADQEAVSATQGDLFDHGFATAGAVEEVVARLVDTLGPVFVQPQRDDHPLADARTRWVPVAAEALGQGGAGKGLSSGMALSLQLLKQPRLVPVRTQPRRDHVVPTAYREKGRWTAIAEAAGPDRVSGGHDGDAFAREYFRCVTAGGRLVWLFRDARVGAWYLHGWWD